MSNNRGKVQQISFCSFVVYALLRQIAIISIVIMLICVLILYANQSDIDMKETLVIGVPQISNL